MGSVDTATVEPLPAVKPTSRRGLRAELVAWLALGLLLFVGAPLFLCMGVWPDVDYHLLFAKAILNGGILERDVMMYFRPPTMAWILIGVKSVFGWSTLSLRFVDLLFVGAIVLVLARWLRASGLGRAAQVWVAFLLFAFYFSTSDWCHCQPDMWMLLPALGGLFLRYRQTQYLQKADVSLGAIGGWAFAEGLVWGVGCLIKPFVAVPGLLCWLITVALYLRRSKDTNRLVADAAGLLLGGLLAGSTWFIWLCLDGGLPYVVGDFRDWFGGYYEHSGKYSLRFPRIISRFKPWSWLHLIAIPVAIITLIRLFIRGSDKPEAERQLAREALMSGFYLGWFIEGNFMQAQYDYHIAPAIFLALVFLAGQSSVTLRWIRGAAEPDEAIEGSVPNRFGQFKQFAWHSWVAIRTPLLRLRLRAGLAALLMLAVVGYAVIRHPLHRPRRLLLWKQCIRFPDSPELKDRLQLDASYLPNDQFLVSWTSLDKVARYLRSQNVRDGDVTCYNMRTVPLYNLLNIKPSTRFPFVDIGLWMYPDKAPVFREALNKSHQRFVVSDLHELIDGLDDYPLKTAKQTSLEVPQIQTSGRDDNFPWVEPIVFRAGPYVVQRVVTKPVPDLVDYRPYMDEKEK